MFLPLSVLLSFSFKNTYLSTVIIFICFFEQITEQINEPCFPNHAWRRKHFTPDSLMFENYPFFKSLFETSAQKTALKHAILKRAHRKTYKFLPTRSQNYTSKKRSPLQKESQNHLLFSLQHRPVVYYSKKHSKVPLKTVKTCVLHQ